MRNNIRIFLAVATMMSVMSASAKITVFTNIDAVKLVITAPKLNELKLKHGDLSSISVVQEKMENDLQTFKVLLTLSKMTPIGNSTCAVKAKVSVVKDTAAPKGISASKLSQPKFDEVVNCSK